MTRLLVSVRNADEACRALAGGADLIDVKEPSRGSLGAASPEALGKVLEAIAGRVPVSAALGELLDVQPSELAHVSPQLAFAKLGMAGCARQAEWPRVWAAALARLPASVGRVAVVYADWRTAAAPSPEATLELAKSLDCAAVLVDTFDKSRGSLCELWSDAELRFVATVREAGLLAVVAGSLTIGDLARVRAIGADFVAVRGAVCRDSREGRLEARLVERFARALREPAAMH